MERKDKKSGFNDKKELEQKEEEKGKKK